MGHPVIDEDEEDVPLKVRFSKKFLKSARKKAGRPKTKNEEEKSLSKESKDEPKDNNTELEIDEDKIKLAQSYEEQNLESNQKNSNTDEEKPLKAPAPSAVAPTSGQTLIFLLNFKKNPERKLRLFRTVIREIGILEGGLFLLYFISLILKLNSQ